ncbi:MAG: hypothetical protein CL916_10245 [Deltaproteobacteria bacterium]|nr:hypothetical protein [Deltaproteobacteria bacterium]
MGSLFSIWIVVCPIQSSECSSRNGASTMILFFLGCLQYPTAEDPPKEKLIQDYDQDGFANDVDCDDLRSEVNPEAPEICDNRDNNCDGLIDDDDLSLVTDIIWYKDHDGDGFGDLNATTNACIIPSGHVGNAEDCDDGDADINPDAEEHCDDVDNNCNDLIDDEDPNISSAELIPIIVDEDGDGFGGVDSLSYACNTDNAAPNSLDCDDTNPNIHPNATDYCDGIDNNCDEIIDPFDELVLIFDDGSPEILDITQEIHITEGMELHNCYDTITPVERLGIETSLSWYNHRENAQLLGSVLIYVNNNVEIYDLNIDVTGSFYNEVCSENTCYPGLMCTMDANVLFADGSIKNGFNVEGGNVFVRACNLTIENSDIFNGISERGAGIYVEFGSVDVQNSYITGNQATQGGGIYIKEGSISGENTHISFNHAQEGGGIYTKESTGLLTSMLIQSNTADVGGGCWLMDSTNEFTNVLVNENIAEQGGGIYLSGASLHLLGSMLNNNIASSGGHAWLGNSGSILWENTLGSFAQGGAVWIQSDGALTCSHTDSSSYSGFFSNQHDIGGAINIADLGTFTGIDCDMGVEGQSEDNFETDIALFSEGILIDTQEANNNANILCTQEECNYQ